MHISDQIDINEDATLRAPVYSLLTGLLVRPPDTAFLQAVANLRGDDTEFGRALNQLASAACAIDAAQAEREFNALFIGVTRGELVPYASYYRTGFLHDRPLARVRDDLNRLTLERVPGVVEPEDHIAGLLEVMALLCSSPDRSTADQTGFYLTHLAPWARRFFRDLQSAVSARLYRAVAELALAFLEIEDRAVRIALDDAEGSIAPAADNSGDDIAYAGGRHVA